MAIGDDTPRGGGADDHFTIRLPIDTTTPHGGVFTVTPATAFTKLVIEGPGSLGELKEEGGSVVWLIEGRQWAIRVE